jgi:hypothetical protein
MWKYTIIPWNYIFIDWQQIVWLKGWYNNSKEHKMSISSLYLGLDLDRYSSKEEKS